MKQLLQSFTFIVVGLVILAALFYWVFLTPPPAVKPEKPKKAYRILLGTSGAQTEIRCDSFKMNSLNEVITWNAGTATRTFAKHILPESNN